MQGRALIAMCLGAAVATTAIAAEAGAATKAQYGAKCNAAWTGKRGTKAFRTYKRPVPGPECLGAALAGPRGDWTGAVLRLRGGTGLRWYIAAVARGEGT